MWETHIMIFEFRCKAWIFWILGHLVPGIFGARGLLVPADISCPLADISCPLADISCPKSDQSDQNWEKSSRNQELKLT